MITHVGVRIKRMPSETMGNKEVSASNVKARQNPGTLLARGIKKQIHPTQSLQDLKCQALSLVTAAVNCKIGSLQARTAGHISLLLLGK